MSELSDFIAQRKATLTARRDELEAELAPIRAELGEIAAIERAQAGPRHGVRESARGLSIKNLILRVLDGSGQALKAAEIHQRIQDDGRKIDRETFSPQLSRLVRSGAVVREGMAYRSVYAHPPASVQQQGE